MVTVRGAFLEATERLCIRDVELPEPAEDEVLLDVEACGVCGSDLHQFFGRWPRPEVVVGHEVGGTVVAVGPGVTCVRPGDAVAVEPIIRCGECRYCLTGRYLLCERGGFISMDVHGGFAEQMVVPAYCCHKLADGVPTELGAFAEPLSVGLHAVRLARTAGERTVLVLGAGTIGLMTVLAAKAIGAAQVLVTAKYPHQETAARALGADDVLAADAALEEAVRQVCPDGPDIVIETVGSEGGTIGDALELVRKLGTVVLVGGWTDAARVNLKPVIFKELTVLGSPCYGQIGLRQDFGIAVELIEQHRDGLTSLVTGRYPLGEIEAAFRAAADKRARAIKVLVKPHEG